jgi:hypothetical protein
VNSGLNLPGSIKCKQTSQGDVYWMSTNKYINKSVALVRERTTPTKRPPLVDEFSAKFAD